MPSNSMQKRGTSTSPDEVFCPPFPTEEALDAYLSSIAAPRELICPITQELMKDPVVAEDGHTYERSSLITWFNMGRTRSPVTNSFLTSTTDALLPNLAVGSMANVHREKLAKELVAICEGVKKRLQRKGSSSSVGYDISGVSVRIEGLLDAGADPNDRGEAGNTPLHLLIQSREIHLANHLLNHDANVTVVNDAGMDCIATAEQALLEQQENSRINNPTLEEWNDFIQELKRRESVEKARTEARDRARTQANEQHRERQRTLAADARSDGAGGGSTQGGLGRLEDGCGYFPSLAALQFQASIPGPSPSLAEHENREKERMNRILKSIGLIILAFFLLT
mmetsp:Transcript_7580/g.11009  ORF Transcript_7580/g.11009 Transcript_7580/m.11009 type:complete len:339 (-) Transcript_7580:9-1025(-)